MLGSQEGAFDTTSIAHEVAYPWFLNKRRIRWPPVTRRSSQLRSRLTGVANETVVPLIEENLQVQKQWVEAGALLIKKEVETQTQTLPADLAYEEVYVERVPVNQALGENEQAGPRQEGDTLVIPVIEEELVITKRRIVREEIRVTKRQAHRQQEMSGEVKREHIYVQHTGEVGLVESKDSPEA